MRITSATTTTIVAVMMLCALSTGGQQETVKSRATVRPQQPRSFVLDRTAHLPDGRVVRFAAMWDERGNPAAMSEEEIDALAKRIAGGEVELPPGARVIGWEPVEGANSLLPEFEQRVATIPTTKGKLDALANAVGILQSQVHSRDNLTNERIDLTFSRIVAIETLMSGNADVANKNADVLNLAMAVAGNADSKLLMLTNQLDNFKRELDEFKDAACPILRRADGGMKLSYACGLH